ncbi:MAG: hypothetical protein AMJ75_10230 [Phycisphaerae bacterium SM1_79]|nr:MAG: hypothetical protein AMJ75_10230 [Phycisphaerae bacterium SM1_79]
MGLQGVEVVMDLEEAFGVELKDDQVVESVTPRMIGDVIFSKLKATDEHICQSQRALYILRKALLNMFNPERKSITPDTRFGDFIGKLQEKEIWGQLGVAIPGRSWPRLARPLWMSPLLIAVTLAIFSMTSITVYAAIRSLLGIEIGFIAGAVLAAVFAHIATKLTRPCKVRIPSRFKSVRDAIPYAITSDPVKSTREQVPVLVEQIVMEELGVKESECTEDSRFVDDFGMN